MKNTNILSKYETINFELPINHNLKTKSSQESSLENVEENRVNSSVYAL